MTRLGLAPLALLVACGNNHNSNPDSPIGIDAAPDAAERGIVTIHVRDGTGTLPLAPSPVVFVDTDGTMTTVMTDESGTVTGNVFAGANATSIYTESPTEFQLQTVFGIAPGDDITLGSTALDQTPAGSFTINFTADSGATSYSVVHPCASITTMSTSPVVNLFNYCAHPSMDLIVISLAANGQPMHFVEQSGVAFTDGGSTTMPVTWQPLVAFSANYTDIGADVSGLGLNRSVPDKNGYFLSGTGPPSGSPRTLQLNGPTAVTSVLQTQLSASTGAYQVITAGVDGTATTYALDVGASELGWLGTPTLDIAAEKVTVPVTGSAAGDGFELILDYDNLANTLYSWNLYAPTAGDIQLPAIPLALGDYLPKTGYNISALVGRLLETTTLDGNKAFRANPGDSFPGLTTSPAVGGVIRLSTSSN